MVTNPSQGAKVEDAVLNVINEGGLARWQQQLIFGLNIRRLEHFTYTKDTDYRRIGLPPEDIKRLRLALHEVQRAAQMSNTDSKLVYVSNNTTASSPTEPSGTLITKEQIKLMELIGEGTFAVVKRALWSTDSGRKIDVAVKILRDVSPLVMEDLKVEAGHLLKLQHPNLIRLYGVVPHPAMMVFELCEGGALLDRLREDKKPIPLLTTLLDYCQQIVKAMSYLETKHCVHRDLACRNILLTMDEKTVKICDFGLMRNLKENEEMYIMGPQKRVPFSWCPPESLKHRKFSHASDVWAFGVTVWEIFSLGEEPWIGCRAIEVLKRLDAGERLEKPNFCSQQIYDIVASCWKVNPDHRPKFSQLKGFLQQAQFNSAEVREAQMETERNLGMSLGDRVLVVQNIGVTWFGQNERTRKFGSFLRSSVFVVGSASAKPVLPPAPTTPKAPILPAPILQGGNSRISLPVQGSFIHTGHADVRGGNSWGRAEGIDDIYLKNPIIGRPREPGIPLIMGSEQRTNITATRVAPPPPKHHENGTKPTTLNVRPGVDPLKPDWGDFDAAQTPSFSPSNIELPPMPTTNWSVPKTSMTASSSSLQSTSYREATRTVEVKPSVPSHSHWNPPPVQPHPSSSHTHNSSHNHNVIFPSGVGVGVLPIHPIRPSTTSPNVLGNGITRPPVATQPIPRPVTDKTKEVNIIKPLDYRHTFNGGPRPSVSPIPVVENGYKPAVYTQKDPNTDRNRNLISELSHRIQPTAGSAVNRPLHAVPPSVTAAPHLGTSSSDPFVISAAVKGVVESTRYNQILEKSSTELTASRLVPNNPVNMTRPHSTVGIAQSSTPPYRPPQPQNIPCLIPTMAPPKAPSSNAERASSATPPMSSVPVVAKPLTVVIPPERKAPQDSSERAPPSASASQPVKMREVPVAAPVRPPPATVAVPVPVAASASPSVSTATTSRQPAVPSAVGVTPAGTLPRATAMSDEDRRSRIEEEIASALPAPSRLFYGSQRVPDEKKPIAVPPPVSVQPPRPHSVASLPSASSSADPLPISLNSVLQPIRLHVPPPPAPAPVPAPEPTRNIDVSAIMNAYHYPMYMNPLNPGYPAPTQVPLFALGGPAVRPAQMPISPPMFGSGVDSSRSANFIVGDTEDIIAALDPLTNDSSVTDVSRASQMEVLYDEASFVDRSRCDEMVKRCDGDIAVALRELKMEHLLNMGLSSDKGRVFTALEGNNWDLNRAAEALL